MRCVVIGTTAYTMALAQGVLESGSELLAIINLEKDLLPNNSVDLKGFAKENNVKYYETRNINDEEELLLEFDMDILVCSWPKILKEYILNTPKIMTICSHPTKLPHNRGRHPMHWNKVLGLREGGVSFFKADSGVDTGDIILQLPFSIEKDDDINDLNRKINSLAKIGIKRILSDESYLQSLRAQDGKANYWRKRNLHDVILDMRMSKEMIISTVKSFTLPYPCAKLLIENKVIDIIDASESSDIEWSMNMEHGKIATIDSDKIVVKCENGLVELKSKNSGDFGFLDSKNADRKSVV